jgi:acyl-coenzyme A thioesterase PaaI-like protein
LLDLEKYRGHATLELKTSYLKAGKPGKYVAKGRVLRMGRSVAYSEAALYDGDGALVSKASATFKLLPK